MKTCRFCRFDTEAPCDSENEARGCHNFKRAGALIGASLAPRKPAPTFKLANLEEVGKLKSRLDYLDTIRRAVNGPVQAKVTIERIDLRPEIAARAVEAIEQALDAEAAKVRDALADLGVEV